MSRRRIFFFANFENNASYYQIYLNSNNLTTLATQFPKQTQEETLQVLKICTLHDIIAPDASITLIF